LKRILGISAFYHDSAAAIIVDGKIIAAAQEERFTRIKHTPDFPTNSIRFCLDYSGYCLNELDAVVFYDKPLLKFERLLETYYAFAPKGLQSFLRSIPVWTREKFLFKKLIRSKLRLVEKYDRRNLKILFSDHHLSHAASAFYCSTFQKAAILTIDGVGEWATVSISIGENERITRLKEIKYPHSIGLLYSSFTYYLGFRVNSGEYKLMGLAPYGLLESDETLKFINLIDNVLIDIKEDGSVWLNQAYFNYSTGLTMINERKWNILFGMKRRFPGDEITQTHCNLALAIQRVVEKILVSIVKYVKLLTNMDFLCYSGGVALNCVANSKILKENLFNDIYIQPASGDAGGAIGAALAVNFMYFNETRDLNRNKDMMMGAYLGPEYSDFEVKSIIKKYKGVYNEINDAELLSTRIAELIDEGNIIGWFQGRMEFGPRSLGNRSILADARNSEMQRKLNLKIKKRESFRPFAPAILSEDKELYFNESFESPYMLFNYSVKDSLISKQCEHLNSQDIFERINIPRSSVPAITHLDYSARVQTVTKEGNYIFWSLINAFKKLTGCSLIINTSFNVRGEPIVCSPEDGYKCFMNSEIDYLVINNLLFKKTDQLNWRDKKFWELEFDPD
jgi:carbamoyltransferase